MSKVSPRVDQIPRGIEFAAVSFLILIVSAVILAPDRGLDLTDEGWYLQALEAEQTHTFGFPWGWHLQPFLILGAEDIRIVRVGFSSLFLLVSFFFGRSIGNLLKASKSMRSITLSSYLPQIFGSLALIFGLTFFDLYLNRTPSYNWVNLFGLMVAMIGIFCLSASRIRHTTGTKASNRMMFLLVSAFGSFFTLVAKPSSSLVVFVLVFLTALISTKQLKQAIFDLLVFVASFGLFFALARLSGVWPEKFWDILAFSFSQPPFTETRSVIGALISELTYVSVIYEEASKVHPLAFPLLLFVAGLLIASMFFSSRLAMFSLVAATIGQVVINGPLRGSLFNYSLLEAGVPNALTAWLLLFATAAYSVRILLTRHVDDFRETQIIILSLAGSMVAYGFGSTMGIFGKTSDGAILAFMASAVLATRFVFMHGNRFIAMAVIVGMAITSIFSLVWGSIIPYRGESIAAQTVEIVAPNGTSIKLDAQRADAIRDYAFAIDAAGIDRSDSVVPLLWRWNSTLPHLTDLMDFPTLMPTLFGYSGELDILESNLLYANRLGFFDVDDVYVLTDVESSLTPGQNLRVLSAVETVEDHLTRTWEQDLVTRHSVEGNLRIISFHKEEKQDWEG